MPSSPTPVRRSSLQLLLLLAGVLLVGAYFLLSGLEIGKFGAEADIGGGLLLLLGYVVTAGGVLLVLRDLVRHRSDQH